jgi:hypothetical protein
MDEVLDKYTADLIMLHALATYVIQLGLPPHDAKKALVEAAAVNKITVPAALYDKALQRKQ